MWWITCVPCVVVGTEGGSVVGDLCPELGVLVGGGCYGPKAEACIVLGKRHHLTHREQTDMYSSMSNGSLTHEEAMTAGERWLEDGRGRWHVRIPWPGMAPRHEI